ncbi:MAG: biotin--[acetyl-CoA-carboxylase] ligase [Rhodospirillales bacterium]|nr:biotin--[acetyl-CoA-carboxylase] ligase [Alphaproteobacteria bacterium]MCB9980856.1 biotin--[acetyl-CoA-carboxylase] ligase [Rhodospirillales bacterium]
MHWDIQVFTKLDSTQDECKRLAVDGGPEGTVVQAIQQVSGRGRHGRMWLSEEGNLAMSFILRPRCEIVKVGQISVMVGVALAQAIGKKAQLKWPNDVLVDGRKCAGILIDSDLSGGALNWLVIGVGVNTHSAPEMGAALNVDCDEFRDAFLENISQFYAEFRRNGFVNIRDEWLERTYPKGAVLNVGTFEGLDEWGNLIVRGAQNQLQTISAGDVFLKDRNYAAGD